MNLSQQFRTDPSLEREGKWVEFGDGASLLIARANNPEATKLRERLMAPFERPGFRNRKPTDADQERITRKVVAGACLRDWKGVELGSVAGDLAARGMSVDPANPVYTPELGEALFELLPDFFRDVLLCSTNEELYRAEQVEADAGN